MRKKILVACFFATLLLAVPCVSAFKMDLSNDQRIELQKLIDKEEEPVKTKLQGLLTEDGSLDISEVEVLLEEAIVTGDYTVIQTDPWTWITERLGWVYLTVENVLDIYYAGMNLYGEITEATTVVQQWFQSLQDLRAAWLTFKDNPLNLQNIFAILNAVKTALFATIALIDEVQSDDLINAVYELRDSLVNFQAFLESNPWEQPITIYGDVTGFTSAVTITTNSDSTSTMTDYSLPYETASAKFSWFVHKCVVTAEYDGKTKDKSGYAFSMGSINMDWSDSDFTPKSKTKTDPMGENLLLRIFEKFNLFIVRLLNNILGQKIGC